MTLGQWLGLLSLGAAFYILWQIRQLVLLLFTAVVLATAANSLVRRFERAGFKRIGALLLTIALCLVVTLLFFALVVPPFVEQVQELVQLVPSGLSRIRLVIPNVIDFLIRFIPPGADGIKDALELAKSMALDETVTTASRPEFTWDFTWLPDQAGNIVTRFFAFFNNALGVAVQLLLVFVLTLMLLVNPTAYRNAFLALFPSFYRRRASEIFLECEEALTNWFSGVMISSTAIAVMSWVGLSALGIDLALAHALLAGVLNFIPNIGPILSMIFPISVAILGPGWKVGAVIALYVLIQNIESYWLTPTVMARQVSLLPALTLVAQVFFATLFGALGLLLSLPLTVVAKTWIQECLIRDVLDRYDLVTASARANGVQVETVLVGDGLGNGRENQLENELGDDLDDRLGNSVAIAEPPDHGPLA